MIPDTETTPRIGLADVLTGARQAAAVRYSTRVRSAPASTVVRDGARLHRRSIAAMDAAELRAHLADGHTVAGAARGSGVARSLAAVSADPAASTGRLPRAAQVTALTTLEASSLTDLELTWDRTRGTPRRVRGVLAVDRHATTEGLADRYTTDEWPVLAAALGADSDDRLERVQSGPLPRGMRFVTYRRVRSGHPMFENIVTLFVTGAAHRAGPGLLLGLRAQWDTDVASISGTPLVAASVRDHAALTLGADGGTLDTSLAWRCRDSFTPRCRLTWRAHDSSVVADGDSRRADTLYVDASTGRALSSAHETAHYTGTVTHQTWWPDEPAMTQRAFRFGELRSWNGSSWDVGSTTINGKYSWTPLASPPWAATVLRTGANQPSHFMALRHRADGTSCVDDPMFGPGFYADGGGTAVVVSPSATVPRRADWMLYYHLQWSNQALNSIYLGAELPSTLWFDAHTGDGGVMLSCNGGLEHAGIAAGAGTDQLTDYPRTLDVFWEELHHAIEWCTATVGAGCGDTRGATADRLLGAWNHNWGPAIGNFYNRYQHDSNLYRQLHDLTYAGPSAADPGDILLYDAEAEGTVTSGPNGCDPVSGTYVCAADEACWVEAMDRPRCMYRSTPSGSPGPTDYENYCLEHPEFADIPLGLMDAKPAGRDPAGENIWICIPSDYHNGSLWGLLFHNLIQGAGAYYGAGAGYWATQGMTTSRTFTQGADNFHDEMAIWAGWYESSRAFHRVSTESFPFFDDATDNWMGSAEVIRMPRTVPLTFTDGASPRSRSTSTCWTTTTSPSPSILARLTGSTRSPKTRRSICASRCGTS